LSVGQVLGWDRLPPTFASVTTPFRVYATLGQHLFLGSYLALLVPLAAARGGVAATRRVPYAAVVAGAVWVAGVLALVQLASSVRIAWLLLPLWGVAAAIVWDRVARRPDAGRAHGVSGAALCGALVALQVVVVFLSGGRSPFLGLLVGLAVVGVM